MPNEFLLELENIFAKINTISDQRRYWLVRTHGGKFYPSFSEFKYISIGHEKITGITVEHIFKNNSGNHDLTKKDLKKIAEKTYPNEQRHGLIASQIFKFYFEIKHGDIVIIPSYNSNEISIGEVFGNPYTASTNQVELTECPDTKRRKVKWEKIIGRNQLDPFLYRTLQAHQAINEITQYADIIERTLGNFYIKEDKANLILNVRTQDPINAYSLFELGYNLLNFAEGFFQNNALPFTVKDVEVKINLNSEGKIQFKGQSLKTIWIIALIVIGFNGGGLKIEVPGKFSLDLSTEGLIKKIIDYQNNAHDREMTRVMMKNFDSLQVESPDDAVKVFQQFNTNKK